MRVSVPAPATQIPDPSGSTTHPFAPVVRTICNPPCAAIWADELGDGRALDVDGAVEGAADA
jgi:hypothetical protein